LSVIDALGREVIRLVDGETSAGAHSIPFDAHVIAGGVYCYRLSTPFFLSTREMIVLR
jgi:hypothetical protein